MYCSVLFVGVVVVLRSVWIFIFLMFGCIGIVIGWWFWRLMCCSGSCVRMCCGRYIVFVCLGGRLICCG